MKRLLSLMVAFAMILSMVPNVFATETTEDMLPSDMETIGSVDNPEVLADLGSYSLTLASGDTDGYYYAYTAIGEGTVSASIESVTAAVVDDNETEIVAASTEEETVTAAVALTNKTTGATGTDSVAVSEGDIVLIQVTSSAAADITWYGMFTYYAGHETNPIWLNIGENVLTVPAGATLYYAGRFGGMVMSAVGEGLTLEHNGTTYTLTAEAQEITCVQASMWEPSTFIITNAGETELACTLTVNYPLGAMENPAALQIGANVATIAEGSQGYYYTWTAEEAGTLSIEMPSDMGWSYTINNMTTYVYGDLQSSDSDPVVNPGTIEVAAGDEIQIMVNTYNPEDPWTAPAGELTVYAYFTAVPGTVNNPLWLNVGENALTIPAGATVYYCGRFGGMVMSAVGEGLTLEHNGTTYTLTAEAQEITCVQASMWDPCLFIITNAGETELTCTLTVNYPLGSMDNPAELQMGGNTATVAEGSQGYYYTWTAEEAGTLTVEMPSDMGWAYVINNMTTYVYGDTQWSDSDPVVNPGTIEVAAGDMIQIMVNTYDPEDPWTAPAGELTFYAYFTAVPGTVNNPLWLNVGENALTIPAGATVYYAGRFGGMVMSAVGEGLTLEHNGTTYTLTAEAQEITCVQASMWDPCLFIITNAGETELTCTLTVNYPLGSMDNPAELQLGANTATVAEGSQGYYYTWTAEEAGTLSIEMPSDMGWAYVINNMTTYVYGDTQWSDSDPVVNPGTIEVAAGDVIQIMVNTYDAENPWTAPAGELTFTASFKTLKFEIVTQPADATAAVGETAVFTVVATGEGLTYKWQYSKNGGETWYNTSMTGYNTASLSVAVTEGRDGYMYHCIITDAEGNQLTSEAATLTVEQPAVELAITSQPADATAAVGETAVFTVVATGEGLTYKWQYSKNGGETWYNTSMTGYNTASLSVAVTEGRNGYMYHCIITDAEGNQLTSEAATLTVELPAVELAITSQPADATAAAGETAVFTVVATGEGLTYKWQYSKNGGETWYNTSMTGYNTASLSVAVTEGRDGYMYHCIITDAEGNQLTSEAATLHLEQVTAITSQPADTTAAAGETAVFTVVATGEGLTYKWQYSKNGGETWYNTSMTGYNTASLSVAVTEGRDGYMYRCIITDAEGNKVTSEAATLTVEQPAVELAITSQPADATAAAGETAVFTVEATGEGLTYKWQYSKNGGETWYNTSMTGYNTASLSVAVTEGRDGYMYRCIITDAEGNQLTSEAATLTVQ